MIEVTSDVVFLLESDAIALESNKEWDDNDGLHIFWADIDEQLQLRIPNKYLEANDWKQNIMIYGVVTERIRKFSKSKIR